MPENLLQLPDHLRLADVLDILVMSVLIYALLAWLRDRGSHAVGLGLALIAALFLAAQRLEMYATLTLFQVGFTALVLSLVVIFQEDLRRGFERLTDRRWLFGREPPAAHTQVVDTIAETACALADKRIGALLVLRGVERLERVQRGGVVVDAVVSMPLLCSIFNADSPGHDGAVIIEGDRIQQLGVHLPLTSNLEATGPGGTRHAAALGLSERCDALVLVVSEERGTISFAQHGRLQPVSPAEVAPYLNAWYARHAQAEAQSIWASLSHYAGLKVIALGVACLAWFLFAYRVDTLQKTVIVPIEYRNLPDGLSVDEPRLTHSQLTLTGSERGFGMLDASALTVSFDLEFVQSPSTYYLPAEENLSDIPEELSVRQIEPSVVEVVVRSEDPQPQEANGDGTP